MRFLVAVVIVFVTMTVSFESSSELNHDYQQNLQSPPTDIEPTRSESQGSRHLEAVAKEAHTSGYFDGITNLEERVLEQDGSKKDFCQALREAAETSSIPVAFFARLLWQESKFQSNVVSRVGAQGVAQFMPATAVEVGLDDPFDPFKALPASAKLLRKLHNQFGNLGLAAAAYNAGSGRIQKWLARRGSLPQETRAYVRIITGNVAEKWLDESKELSLSIQLPRGAPCEGVGGLTSEKWVDVMPVRLAPLTSDAIRKAAAEEAAQQQAALKSALVKRAKARMVLSSKGSKTTAFKTLASNKPLASKPERPRNVRVALASRQ
ncbi:lytic transglycosylase domain-containing protein [Bradyrhizobium sp. AUGA SZCCT0169]|uniref:lytic transglycosylase domain-containing protein n=1 Tax=Bradyrhizobium sp. AUGA SZCCT0169 TaxID=2807663 RepID=UPI001BAD90F5|nr:lytic transglycosylase domain-containing protein [Bradyrhizobium sp. AUGA SZCCT0169]